MKDILVIGGSNIDIKASSLSDLVLHDSNIGTFTLSHGGVSRNVVENLLRLHDDVLFLTAVGKDAEAERMMQELKDLGGKVYSLRDDEKTAHYIAIHDNDGDLHVAVCDSKILDTLEGEHFRPYSSLIETHKEIVLDTNLSKESLDYLFSTYPGHKFYVEGVSANKIVRIKEHLKQMTLLKCNRMEANYLLGTKDQDGRGLAKEFFERGLPSAVITDGSEAVTVLEKGKIYSIPVKKEEHVVSTIGCGDALFAGILHGLCHGWDLVTSVRFGIRLSSLTLLSPFAVDPDIGKKILG